MNIGDFRQVPEDRDLKRASAHVEKKAPGKKVKLDFQETLHEVHQIDSLSEDAFQKQLPHIVTSVRNLFSAFKEGKNRITGNDLRALSSLHDKLKHVAGTNKKVVKEINFLSKEIAKRQEKAAVQSKLIQAAKEGQIDTVRLLHSQGANLNEEDNDGFTPLMWAVENNRVEVAEFLLSHGVDVNSHNTYCHADSCVGLDDDRVTLRRYSSYFTPLHWAVRRRSTDVIKVLLSHGADANIPDRLGKTPLMVAAQWGWDLSVFQVLLNSGPEPLWGYVSSPAYHRPLSADELQMISQRLAAVQDVNSKDSNGRTLLSHAAENGHTDIVKLLHSHGANLNEEDNDQWTPLMWAVEKNQAAAADFLLSHGVSANSQSFYVHSADLIELNVREQGAYQLNSICTPLHYAVSCGSIDVVKVLLSHGADVNIRDRNGESPLWRAAAKGDLSTAQVLINAGADVTVCDRESRPILFYLQAVRPPHWKLMRQLIKAHSSAAACNYAKFYKHTKLVAHAFAFKGSSTIEGKKIDWEAGQAEIAAHQMALSIPLFAETSSLLDKTAARHLAQSLHFAADQASRKPEQIIDRISRGMPTFILAGYKGHFVTALIWKDLIAICDRQKGVKTPLQIHRYDQTKLSSDAIEILLESRYISEKEYDRAVTVTLPRILGFTQTENELNLQKLINILSQIVGNCSWAATEGMIQAYLFLEKLKDSSFMLDSSTSIEIKNSVETIFASWVAFQQMLLLEKYIMSEHDDQLILQSFNALRKAKSMQPHAFENLSGRLEELEKMYLARAPSKEAETLRINKASSTVIPSGKSQARVFGILGTLSFLFNLKTASNSR